jgi:putative ABC transport system permease protein
MRLAFFDSRLLRTVRLGFKSLFLHKLRSGLATLGILIGVTAVIWLVALGEGVSYQAQQQIKELGATNIIVRSVKPPAQSSRPGASSFVVEYGLTRDDFDRIASIPTVKRAVPLREIRKEVRYQTRVVDARFIGCTPAYFEMNHLTMARGRFLTDRDQAQVDNVCVIAAGVAEQLFPFEDPLGKAIQVEDTFYVIVGQTASRAPSASIGGSLEGRDYNYDIYIPLTTLRARIGDLVITARSGSREGEVVQLSQVTVTVGDVSQVEEAADIITILLEKYHKAADYSITVPKELLRQAEMLRLMFNVLLILIAGISLVVGGIGIMNIMLATVTERTREIGIRRAMGAKRRDIIYQFLAETIVLTGTGGLLGIAFGFLCKPAVAGVHRLMTWFPDIYKSLPPTIQNLDPRIAPWSIIAAAGISVFVGVIFGLYPAQRAAAMDPIEALRHE